MIFLSELKGKPIWDAGGEQIGVCLDLLIADLDRPLPEIKSLAVKDNKGAVHHVRAEQVGWLRPSILLNVDAAELDPYEPAAGELRLGEQLLDRQIVDAEGRRVVRVNDIQIARVGDAFCVIGVDVGAAGLLRRLGLESASKTLLSLFKTSTPETIIPWEDVAPLQMQGPLRLRISGEKISKLHPADIASIVRIWIAHTGQALINPSTTRRWPMPWRRFRKICRWPSSRRWSRSARPISWKRWRRTRPPTWWPTCPPRRASDPAA